MRSTLVVVAVALTTAALMLPRSPAAWDTCLEDSVPKEWESIYLPLGKCIHEGPTSHSRNEHPEIADVGLKELLRGGLFGVDSPIEIDIVDLNASLFRAGFLKDTTRKERDSSLAPLETRILPAPARFAGLPDFNYTVYDWINKGTACVPLPGAPLADDKCHKLAGVLGAINSSHFGSQAEKNYSHLHGIALSLARKASELRIKLTAADTDGRHLSAYEKFVKEAELAALAYEGVAQHFLQDRWSSGHMWERWAAGSYEELQGTFYSALVVGGITGLIHGSEAVVGPPDMMSSPEIVASGYLPAQARREPDPAFSVVGDYRFTDMRRRLFGGDYPALPVARALDVAQQEAEMMRCVKAGWAEVIRAFGSHRRGFGIHGAEIASDPGPLQGCFNVWVTNETMKRGAVDDPVLGLALSGRVAVGLASSHASGILNDPVLAPFGGIVVAAGIKAANKGIDALGVSEREITRLLNRISATASFFPMGTDLARGAIGPFNGFDTGNHFGASSLLEPQDLDKLPDDDGRRGRDKKAVFGFFNRAFTEHWCTELPAQLKSLRGKPPGSVETAACAYLADRAYDGTQREYDGVQAEKRTKDGQRLGTEVKPICEVLGLNKYSRDNAPLQLRPGYVENISVGAYDRARPDVSTSSVMNWCLRVPVLDLLGGSTPSADDLVVEVNDTEALIALAGIDLGSVKGKLSFRSVTKGKDHDFQVTEFASWTDKKLEFRLPRDRSYTAQDYFVSVERGTVAPSPLKDPLRPADDMLRPVAHAEDLGDNGKSVGRFVVRIKDPWTGLWARGESRIRIKRDGKSLSGVLEKASAPSRAERDFREGMEVLRGTIVAPRTAQMQMLAHYDGEWRERCEAAKAGYWADGLYQLNQFPGVPEMRYRLEGTWEDRILDERCAVGEKKIEQDRLLKVTEESTK